MEPNLNYLIYNADWDEKSKKTVKYFISQLYSEQLYKKACDVIFDYTAPIAVGIAKAVGLTEVNFGPKVFNQGMGYFKKTQDGRAYLALSKLSDKKVKQFLNENRHEKDTEKLVYFMTTLLGYENNDNIHKSLISLLEITPRKDKSSVVKSLFKQVYGGANKSKSFTVDDVLNYNPRVIS